MLARSERAGLPRCGPLPVGGVRKPGAGSPTTINSTGSKAVGCAGNSTERSSMPAGAALGYPALILDADGSAVNVQVFESFDVPAHWSRLDEFEGPGYERVVKTVRTVVG